jgi:undecaprenyl-diphosphatase
MYGFCSSHAANSFALAMAVYLLNKNKWVGFILFFWAFLISYSRIYLGAHYPLDVFVGAILGILGSLALKKILYDKLIKKA